MNWGLSFVTADVPGAGTNADTHVIIYGPLGQSPAIGYVWVLDNPGDDTEQGDTDMYLLDIGGIGVPNMIHLWFDPKGQTDAAWFCSSMRLQNADESLDIRFPVNRWFREQGWYLIRAGKQVPAWVAAIPAGQPGPPPVR
ncbi:MAG: PLAT/LH2 domain-containing protein [Gemmataceae bacterium]